MVKTSLEAEPSDVTENWNSFYERIADFPTSDRRKLMRAYNFSKSAHRDQTRIGGERYFEHPRAVFLILFDECGIRDTDILAASLLHDVCEDTGLFGNVTKIPQEEWLEFAKETITLNFGEKVASPVLALTKPNMTDWKERNRLYHQQLEGASLETILVKMADRLHNLRTSKVAPKEKQREWIKETRETYWPLFEKVLVKYPKEGKLLLDKIGEAITELESN